MSRRQDLAVLPPHADAAISNLPVRLTSFLGREREVRQLTLALRNSRLVTVTGAGGSGKTRLALQSAAESAGGRRDGASWVELGPLADGVLVGLAVAGVLGLRKEPGRAIALTLIEQLQDRDVLLVLDNAEHVLEETSSLVEQLLLGAPGVRFLVTSREPLRVPGEVTWRAPSLAGDGAELLFVERARLARPDFAPAEDERCLIRGLCARLDGLPLAIELAASRIRMMSVARIAESLDERFRLLTASDRSALPRQRTLEASVAWSYGLLTELERTVLRLLSVFASFTAAAAEQVCTLVGIDRRQVLDLLGHLVDKSIVQADDAGMTRYRLLETVRDFSFARLVEAREHDAVSDAHLAYFVAYAEEVAPRLCRSDGLVWLARLDQDRHNLEAALQAGRQFRR